MARGSYRYPDSAMMTYQVVSQRCQFWMVSLRLCGASRMFSNGSQATAVTRVHAISPPSQIQSPYSSDGRQPGSVAAAAVPSTSGGAAGAGSSTVDSAADASAAAGSVTPPNIGSRDD